MSNLKPGDLVMIILEGDAHHGCVGTITRQCSCFCAFGAEVAYGLRVFQVSCSASHCFREDALKKIGGGKRETDVTETDEAAA